MAATALDDKRVVKIILEATQVLSVALQERGLEAPYKPSHQWHPVTRWVCESDENFRWAMQYGIFLCEQYKLFGNKDFHKCEPILRAMQDVVPWHGDLPTKFQNSARNVGLGLDFTHMGVTKAYRQYLLARWPKDTITPTWRNRNRPTWAVF